MTQTRVGWKNSAIF